MLAAYTLDTGALDKKFGANAAMNAVVDNTASTFVCFFIILMSLLFDILFWIRMWPKIRRCITIMIIADAGAFE